MTTFSDAVDAADKSVEDQETLVEILRRRIAKRNREALVRDVAEFRTGQARTSSVSDTRRLSAEAGRFRSRTSSFRLLSTAVSATALMGLVSVFSPQAVAEAVASTDFANAEKAILKARNRLSTAKVNVKGELEIDGDHSRYTAAIWISGDQIREDRTGQNDRRRIRCFDGSKFIFWEEDEVPQKLGIGIHMIPASAAEKHPFSHPSDPRLYGLRFHHTEMISSVSEGIVSDFLGTRDRNEFRAYHDGPDRIVGEWDNDGTAHVKVVLGVNPKPHVKRVDTRSSIGSAFIECTPQFPHGLDVGFPKELVSYQEVTPAGSKPGELFMREKVTIEVALPKRVDPAVFTLAGMEIPKKNIYVMDDEPTKRSPQFWDGESVQDGYVETSGGSTSPDRSRCR